MVIELAGDDVRKIRARQALAVIVNKFDCITSSLEAFPCCNRSSARWREDLSIPFDRMMLDSEIRLLPSVLVLRIAHRGVKKFLTFVTYRCYKRRIIQHCAGNRHRRRGRVQGAAARARERPALCAWPWPAAVAARARRAFVLHRIGDTNSSMRHSRPAVWPEQTQRDRFGTLAKRSQRRAVAALAETKPLPTSRRFGGTKPTATGAAGCVVGRISLTASDSVQLGGTRPLGFTHRAEVL